VTDDLSPPPPRRLNDMGRKKKRRKQKPKGPKGWQKGQSGNPAGTLSNLGSRMVKFRRDLHTEIARKFDASHVVEVMEAYLEHVRDRHDKDKGYGWQKSADAFLDRMLGRPKTDSESEPETAKSSRADLVIELRRTFGLTVTHASQPEQEYVEGEVAAPPKALPGGTGREDETEAGSGDAVLPLPEEVDHGPSATEDR
jgi:hypothetical protein